MLQLLKQLHPVLTRQLPLQHGSAKLAKRCSHAGHDVRAAHAVHAAHDVRAEHAVRAAHDVRAEHAVFAAHQCVLPAVCTARHGV